MTTLVLEFKKIENDDKTNYSSFYSNPKEETVVNESDIDDVFESVYITVISKIPVSLRKGSGCIIDSVADHNISIQNKTP